MAFRIEAVETVAPRREKRPRVSVSKHLDAIRALPCLICLATPSEAAHIRSGSRRHGKRSTGIAEKPSDLWTLPLCAGCHRMGPGAQHSGNELAFYRRFGVDPFVTALALWAASEDAETMAQIIVEARAR